MLIYNGCLIPPVNESVQVCRREHTCPYGITISLTCTQGALCRCPVTDCNPCVLNVLYAGIIWVVSDPDKAVRVSVSLLELIKYIDSCDPVKIDADKS